MFAIIICHSMLQLSSFSIQDPPPPGCFANVSYYTFKESEKHIDIVSHSTVKLETWTF